MEEQEIKDRVKELRTEYLKLSQKKFGETIGLTQTTIYDMEIGKCKVTERNISIICKTHNVNERWLRCGEPPVFNEENKYITMYNSLEDKHKEVVNNVINALYDKP